MFELLEGLGIEILGGTQSELPCRQVTDGTTVHRIVHGTCGRHHLDTLLLKLKESLRTDGLNLRHDDVGLVFFHHCLQCITVEHGEHLTLISHLHGRGMVVTVTGNYILSGTLGRNHELFTQFS